MKTEQWLASFVVSVFLTVSVVLSILSGQTGPSSDLNRHDVGNTRITSVSYPFPIEHVDKDGDLVFVTLEGITQGTEMNDLIPEVVRTINRFGGLAASKQIIEFPDAEGNVVMRIPEELILKDGEKLHHTGNNEEALQSISHEVLVNMIHFHDEKVKEWKAAQNMSKLILSDNKEWPKSRVRNGVEG
ncbi:hypothetical protein NDK47_00985 [Brevibacillus ruminantium]|uniref:GerMN domain-containing protein n=1 Tax=Brevibacillus ruminantium TaxID=2950604 RepID=A0ABY4WGH4_9BACL|nr:hypothetical protein [Brevibacillus ruminantium]USG65964.1 hypothetical protein NDK47_00985 [Brevibacillus ruminantium]